MNSTIRKKLALTLAACAGLGAYGVVKADTALPGSSFTTGDLVVLRGGSAAEGAITGTGTTDAFLDEYSLSSSSTPSAATYAGTLDVPSSTSGSNNPLTITSGGGSHEGQLLLSANGADLTFGGYDNAPDTGSGGAGVSDVVAGEVGQNASTMNTSTLLPAATIRAVSSIDGNEFFISDEEGTNAGLEYVSSVGATSQTAINANWDTRSSVILGGTDLVIGTGSSSLGGHGVWQIGSASTLPTSATTSDTEIINNTTDADSMSFTNLPTSAGFSGSYEGFNTLYTVGGGSGAASINKYAYNSTAGKYNLVNSVTPSGGAGTLVLGLAIRPDPNTANAVDLFYSEQGGVFEIIDNSGTEGGTMSSTSTEVVTASSDEFIDGIAFAPTAVPEPTSLCLLAMGAGGLLIRRRKRTA
jgi:hypothetical protein